MGCRLDDAGCFDADADAESWTADITLSKGVAIILPAAVMDIEATATMGGIDRITVSGG